MIMQLAKKIMPTSELNGTILIVEDDVHNLSIVTQYMHNAGYAVDQAADGMIALKKLKGNHTYSLVITDRNMPQMSGLELVEEIRKDSRLKNIPVIVQTGATSQQEISEGLKSEIYYYLLKPYQEEALITVVQSAIRDSKQRDFFADRINKQKSAMGTFCYGKFELKTKEEAENIAFLLGSLFPRPELATMGLYELILNAIEHGNLGIGYEAKSELLARDSWKEELVRRSNLSENASKKVTIVYSTTNGKIHVTITDEGQGFDWRQFLEIEPSRATQGNGRGIAKANLLCFDEVTYQNKGNTVHVTKLME